VILEKNPSGHYDKHYEFDKNRLDGHEVQFELEFEHV